MEWKNGNKFLILDGHSLVYRAFFALPLELQTKKGLHTNAVLGFTNMLLRLIEDQSPAYILTTFDYPAPTFRHRVFHDYKATREKTPPELKEQLPLIKEILQALNIAVWEMEGYEADDLLGAFAKEGEKEALSTCIVTADADVYQLLSPQVKILITRQGITRLEELTEEKFQEKFGLSPRQWVDYKALKGDASDNIPGVPGIGKKRALQLLKKYNSLEEVLSNAGDIPGKMGENLSIHGEQALMSKELATICVDIPLGLSLADCRMREPDWDGLQQIFNRLELRSLAKKIPELARRFNRLPNIPQTQFSGPATEAVQFTLGDEKKNGATRKTERYSGEPGAKETGEESTIIKNIDDLGQLARLCREARSGQPFSLLLNTVLPRTGPVLKGLACAPTKDNAYYIILNGARAGKETGEGSMAGGAVTLPAVFEALQPLLENSHGMLLTHNLKPLLKLLVAEGIQLACPAFDTRLAAYLLQPERPGYHLPVLLEEHLGLSLPPVDRGLPAEEESRQEIRLLTLCSRHLFALRDVLLGDLENRQLEKLFFDLEMPLAHVLAKMELRGIKIATEVWDRLAREMDRNMSGMEEEIMELAGEEFNLNSPQQLSYILFEKLGLPVVRRTKTGYSTDARVLQELSALHPIVARIMEYRTMAKLKGTYLQGMRKLIDPQTGKIYTTFNQTVTATGRLSSKDPNLQNIPVRLAEGRRLRQAFIPSHPDNLLLAADYSQIELRVMAHLSQDPGLVAAFQKDEDIHRRTAAEVFNVSPTEVTSLMRERAKAVNFGIIYGISDYGLAQDLQIPRAEARRYIENYFARYPGVKKYADECIRLAREKGYVKTLLKRRRYLPEINHPNFSRRSVAERAARNTPIQGSAADLIKAAMLAIDADFEQKGLAAVMLLQVHDELVFELPPKELPAVAAGVKELMENIFPLLVPLKIDLKAGPDWYSLEPIAGRI